MAITATDILEKINEHQRHTVVVTWRGPTPDLTKEIWEMCVTNDEYEKWALRDKGLTKHYVFDLEGIEHARRLYADLCGHFNQTQNIGMFNADGVNTGRRIFFLVKVTLGK